MGSVFVDYLAKLVAVPRLPMAIGLLTAVSALNYVGVGLTGKTTRLLVGAKLCAIAAFILAGIPRIDWHHFTPFAPHGVLGIFATLPLLTGLFGGIESAAEVGDEIRNNRTSAPRGMTLAVLASFIVYAGTALVTIGVLGAPSTAAARAPLASAADQIVGGSVASHGMVVIALISIAAALNTLILVTSRFVFAMGRDGILPSAVGDIHPRTGTPHIAIVVTYGLGLLSFLMPSSLIFLFLAANAPTVLKYGSNCVGALRLVARHPELLHSAQIRLSPRAIKLTAIAGVACAAWILLAGLAADVEANLLLAGWAVLGTGYWALRSRRAARDRNIRPAHNV
jgi:APA family basic amino acid/polyamine antiporter